VHADFQVIYDGLDPNTASCNGSEHEQLRDGFLLRAPKLSAQLASRQAGRQAGRQNITITVSRPRLGRHSILASGLPPVLAAGNRQLFAGSGQTKAGPGFI